MPARVDSVVVAALVVREGLKALRSPGGRWDPKPQWKCYLREE